MTRPLRRSTGWWRGSGRWGGAGCCTSACSEKSWWEGLLPILHLRILDASWSQCVDAAMSVLHPLFDVCMALLMVSLGPSHGTWHLTLAHACCHAAPSFWPSHACTPTSDIGMQVRHERAVRGLTYEPLWFQHSDPSALTYTVSVNTWHFSPRPQWPAKY